MKQIIKLINSLLPSRGNDLKSKAIKNTYWLFFDQFVRMGIGFFSLAILARQFGPEAFGKLNYAIAFVSLFSFFSTLGLERILIREIISDKINSAQTLATGFFLKIIGGGIIFIITTLVTQIIDSNDQITQLLVMIFAVITIFQSFDVIEYWYQAEMESKYSVIAKIIPFIFISFAKIYFSYTNPSLLLLGLLYLLEIILSSLGLLLIFKYKNKRFFIPPQVLQAKQLLKESLPLIFSTIFVTIYLRIDQILLSHLATDEIVGIYSAAVKISEIPFVIGSILTSAAFPIILKSKLHSEKMYYDDLQLLFSFVVILAIIIAGVITLFASSIINLVYGSEYQDAIRVLQLHIWSLPFVFLGTAQGIWAVTEKFTKIVFIATFSGAITNIILNIILIPHYGAVGAVLATVFSYALSGFFINFFFKETRVIIKLQCKAIYLPVLLKELKRKFVL